jgi:stage IV sporulation protein FB
MNTRLELGRIGGIPVFLDMFFVLVLMFFSHRYFTSGDSQQISAGILIIAGIIASILLHELGHAVVGWLFKVRVAEIALTGLGGVIQFDSSLPRAALPRVAIYLAGPAVNFGLYWGAAELAQWAAEAQKPVVLFVLVQLATINLFLCLFNLLPAFPLDGGHALDAIVGKLFGAAWGNRVVGPLGIVVALVIGFFAIQSLPGSIFLLLLAYFLADLNWTAFQNAGRGWHQ